MSLVEACATRPQGIAPLGETMLGPGDTLGPYTLVRLLGQGGFGDVWLAQRETAVLTMQVALKLPRGAREGPDAIRREAHTWQRASGHPNIVPVLDADLHDGHMVIASEFIVGGTLTDWLRANGGRSPDVETTVRMMDGILSGLWHLHSAGLAHRDLKPDNVLLQAGVPRLTDFGLTRVLTGRNLSEHLSGSSHYMAPETFSGAYSPASDLWAAGVILYEMLSGALPFDKPDFMHLLAAIRDDAPAPVPPGVPDSLRAVVERLLSRSPDARFGSARETLTALRGAQLEFARAPAAAVVREEERLQPPDGAEATGWFVELMGGLKMSAGDRTVDLRTRNAAALVARLAYEPGRAFDREALMEMLWPNQRPEQQRNNMSVELHRLRRRLELPGVPGTEILSGVDTLRLNSQYVSSDTSKLVKLAGMARDAELPPDRLEALREAASLYRPEFLPNVDCDWVPTARAELKRVRLEITEKLITEFGHIGDHERAIENARALVEEDRFAEERHGLLIFALVRAGRPCDAASHFDTMVRLWREEYGTSPGPRAVKLGEEAKRQCAAAPVIAEKPRPHNGPVLPATFSTILGREAKVDSLKALLLDPATRLVTLTGTGGNGKTRLAIEVAQQMAEPLDGAVWFIRLTDLYDRSTIVDSLRNVLGLSPSPDRDTIEQIAETLSAQPSLLALDNFEHLTAREADLVEVLLERVASLTCLVTSRQSLQLPMELIVDVPALPLPALPSGSDLKGTGNLEGNACVQLFTQRAHRARPGFALTPENSLAVVEICRRLDGIPLAIELAAAWARMLTPADMLAQLKEILVSRDRSVPEKHRSLTGVIAASFVRLQEEAQRFLTRLSVFRGGWTSEAARSACGEPLCVPLLGELQDASLIVSYESGATMRFRMLEPIRDYAEERLVEAGGKAESEAQHLTYFLDFASRAAIGLRSRDQSDWLRCLDDELPNLRYALASARQHDRLVACAGLQRFWIARGRMREGLMCMEGSLAALDETPDEQRGSILLAAGILAYRAGEVDLARAHLHSSLAYCRARNSVEGMAKALANLANIAGQRGEYDEARRDFEACLDMARRLEDYRMIAGILSNLGALCNAHGDPREARDYLAEAYNAYRRLPDDLLKADILHNLAGLHKVEGDFLQATKSLLESLRIRQGMGDRNRAPEALLLLATVGVAVRQYEDAVVLLAAHRAAHADLGSNPTLGEREEYEMSVDQIRQNLPTVDVHGAESAVSADHVIDAAIDVAERWCNDLSKTTEESQHGRLR